MKFGSIVIVGNSSFHDSWTKYAKSGGLSSVTVVQRELPA